MSHAEPKRVHHIQITLFYVASHVSQRECLNQKPIWDGEPWVRHYCLFPYDLASVTIDYEGHTIHNIASGDDHLDVGSPTYNLSGN